MASNPKISVIIPVLNRQDIIERCLDSVLNQTVKPYEMIVVDNASSDDTYNRVESWIKKHSDSEIKFLLLTEPKKGACEARQKGFEYASGDYLSFFDSDDEMLPSLIEEALLALETYPTTDIVCWNCRINLLDGTSKVPPIIRDNQLESHLIHTLLRPQGYIVEREFLSSAGGWSKPIKVWNDYELGLRLILQDPKVIIINKVLGIIHSQENSITGKDFSSKQGLWEKTLDEMEKVVNSSNHPQKEKIKKILNYRRAILASCYYRERNKIGAGKLITLAKNNKSLREKLLLKFSYHFTRFGLRGVWRIVRYFY